MKKINYETDLCVVGGGIAGLCTAISAARHGIKVILIHDRPVLGGNASSEIRMWICGAHGVDNRETGLIEEFILENYYQNPSHKYTLWDSVLYGKAITQENLTLLLNASVLDAECENNTITSVTAWQSNAETFHTVKAKYFADCSGDSILAPLSGAEYRYGRESKLDFGETIPPDIADKKTMGMSCIFQTRETDHKVEYTPPEWAYKYESDDDLPYKDTFVDNNFWWIEIGGEWDCIHDTDRCRDELLKICFGVWDHMKNYGDHGADNWELEWIGFLPGKRESRRYVGEYTVTQNDVESEGRFDDMVAYAGWSMDDHFPAGFYHKDSYPTIYHPAPQPWGLPLRAMISCNISNLVFAGRNISVTHAALSSSRVMATCSILGQALGTAIAQAIEDNVDIRNVDISKLQNSLMFDDCYIPWHVRQISAKSTKASCSSPIVINGIDRGDDNCWVGKSGDYIEFSFENATDINGVRLVFDSNLNRSFDGCEEHNMPCCYPLIETHYQIPETLIKTYSIECVAADGKTIRYDFDNNHQRFVINNFNVSVKSVRFIPKETYGAPEFRVFAFEII